MSTTRVRLRYRLVPFVDPPSKPAPSLQNRDQLDVFLIWDSRRKILLLYHCEHSSWVRWGLMVWIDVKSCGFGDDPWWCRWSLPTTSSVHSWCALVANPFPCFRMGCSVTRSSLFWWGLSRQFVVRCLESWVVGSSARGCISTFSLHCAWFNTYRFMFWSSRFCSWRQGLELIFLTSSRLIFWFVNPRC